MSWKTEQKLNGMQIVVSPYVDDYKKVKRSWKERLLTIPWRPFEKYKSVCSPKVYQADEVIYCSPQTYSKIRWSK